MIVEPVTFSSGRGSALAGRIHKPDTGADTGVVFSHGLLSSKDGYKINRLSADIVSAGCILLTFDFSGAGESSGEISDRSILKQVEDLDGAVNALGVRGVKRIHLMGSSMGAAVAILYASRNNPLVRSLALIAAPVDLAGMMRSLTGMSDPAALPAGGTTAIRNIPIKNSFFLEIKEIDMIEAVRNIRVPVMAIQGGRDAVVAPYNMTLLENNVRTEFSGIIIPDGDHNLTRDSDILAIRRALVPWLKSKS